MNSDSTWQAIEAIFRESLHCRICFNHGLAEGAFIDLAQPKWIGPNYFSASIRIMVVAINPGAGNTAEKRKTNEPFRQILYDYRDGKKNLSELFAFQREHIPQWGSPPGRFKEFYIDGMGLPLDDIVFANIAWCSTAGNKYPRGLLNQCFNLHTGRLIQTICPDVVILSGSKTHHYAAEIKRVLPNCEVLRTRHYARIGLLEEVIELILRLKVR